MTTQNYESLLNLLTYVHDHRGEYTPAELRKILHFNIMRRFRAFDIRTLAETFCRQCRHNWGFPRSGAHAFDTMLVCLMQGA